MMSSFVSDKRKFSNFGGDSSRNINVTGPVPANVSVGGKQHMYLQNEIHAFRNEPKFKSTAQVYKILLCYAIIMFFTNSCSTLKYTTKEPKQPRQEYYTLSKEINAQTANIDTTLIYVHGQDWILNGDFGSKKKISI